MTKTDPNEKQDSNPHDEIAYKEALEWELTHPTLNEQEWDQERMNWNEF